MRVLVTGGTGFLGKHVCGALKAAGHYVIQMSSAACDLREPFAFENDCHSFEPDAVIHLAALCGGIGINVKRPADFWRDNLVMGINVLEGCRHACVQKLITAGTTCGYPEVPKTIPFCESELFDGYPEPTNAPYGIAKRALVVGSNAYKDQYNLDARVLMPTNLYGPGDSLNLETNHVIPALIIKFLQAQEEGRETVELWGDGTPTRDFLYVKDAAEAFVTALESESDLEWDILNLGTGTEVAIKDLAETIAELTGYTGKLEWSGQLGGQPRRALNCEAAEKLLGWKAKTDLRTGLTETVEWVKQELAGIAGVQRRELHT